MGAASPIERELIIGGTAVDSERYPYFTLLFFNSVDGKNDVVCGGTLIHKDLVLTAAHCYDKTIVNLATSTASVGISTFASGSTYITRKIASVTPHPNYKLTYTAINDIMIVKLAAGVWSINPIKLNFNSAVPATGAFETVMGFGVTSEAPNTATNYVLREVAVSDVEHGICQGTYGQYLDAASMMCAYNTFKGTCYGDSGGPLITKGSSTANDVQLGIVSYAVFGCAKYGTPTVFTRVSNYASWIKNQTCVMSSYKPTYCVANGTTKRPTRRPTRRPTSRPVAPTPHSPVFRTKTPTKAPTKA